MKSGTATERIKLAIAEDHPLTRKGMVYALGESDRFEVVIEAKNGSDLIRQIDVCELFPDICLLDIRMPELNGFDTAAQLKKQWPQLKIIAHSMFANEQVIIKMLRQGATGFVPKDADPAILREAVISVWEKGYYFSDSLSGELFSLVQRRKKLQAELSKRELELLSYCCTDLTYVQIADEMNTSVSNVDAIRASLFKKLQIQSRSGLVVYAMTMGLI